MIGVIIIGCVPKDADKIHRYARNHRVVRIKANDSEITVSTSSNLLTYSPDNDYSGREGEQGGSIKID